MNATHPRSSALVDLKDPIQVHLLTETALTDSKTYEILSEEEVDDLKKQIQSLTLRIEQTRANLAIQSKYRDAAISMTRLYSPTRADSKRRSLLGNRLSGGDPNAKEAELERQASERRCEELATELYSLEKRIVEPERRLLQHTAAILQMTHRASAKRNGPSPPGQLPNGIPGSPESLYTYSNGRNSMEPPSDDLFPDDWNLYPSALSSAPKDIIEIPVKSPVREQNTQLRGEADRLREQVSQLQRSEEQLRTASDNSTKKRAEQLKTISDAQTRLEGLNNQLRDVIVKFNPGKNGGFSKAPSGPDSLTRQLEYLEMGRATATEVQILLASQANEGSKETDAAAARAA